MLQRSQFATEKMEPAGSEKMHTDSETARTQITDELVAWKPKSNASGLSPD